MRKSTWKFIQRLARHAFPATISLAVSTSIAILISFVGERFSGSQGGWFTLSEGQTFVFIAISASYLAVFTWASYVKLPKKVEERVSHAFRKQAAGFIFLLPVSIAVAAATVITAVSSRFLAGWILVSFSFFRLFLRFATPAWTSVHSPWNSIQSHVRTEVFFHAAAIFTAALGASLMISGLERTGFLFATRVSLIATLLLAAVIAVNKVTTRSRKVCTAIKSEVQSVVRAQAGLSAAIRDSSNQATIADKRQNMIESIEALETALSTQVNTGYRSLGGAVLPQGERDQLTKELQSVAMDSNGKPKDVDWKELRDKLNTIENTCKRWTDIAA
ncbi:hypothetical protein ACFV16_20940 [Streptomyces massasporeus]|uniref:hypothetical protein n=1 Tax=Streptomyces massasporeus TaxID=67324 RepID=UPI0036A8B74D